MSTTAKITNNTLWRNLSIDNLYNEEWKPIIYAPNSYLVSNLGRIKSVLGKEPKIMKLNTCKGYLVIKLSGEANRKDFRVNRLVAEHFLDNSKNLPEVNHINEIKTDNTVGNLEWCSKHYNVNHGTAIIRAVITKSTPIVQVDNSGKIVNSWINAREAARKLGFTNSNIYKALKSDGKRIYKGFKWYYKDSYASKRL